MNSKRLWLITISIMVAITIVAATVPIKAQGAGKPIRIGLLTNRTGQTASDGQKIELLSKWMVEQVNAAGGLNGDKVELVVYDTASDPQQAVIYTRKLATEDKIPVILEHALSSQANVSFPIANELQVPIISPTSALPGIAAKNRPWTFRNTMTDEKSLGQALDLFAKRYNVKKVALVGDMKDAFSKYLATRVLPQVLKAKGIEILSGEAPIALTTGQTDYSAQVTKIKELKPDAIAIGAIHPEAAGLALEMKRQGLKIPAIGGTGIMLTNLVQVGGDAVEGWMGATSFWPDKPDPKLQDFVAKFEEIAGKKVTPTSPRPDYAQANNYDAFNITFDIIRKAGIRGDTDLTKARTALRDGWAAVKGYPGIAGNVTIGPDGEGELEVYVLTVKDGKWQRYQP